MRLLLLLLCVVVVWGTTELVDEPAIVELEEPNMEKRTAGVRPIPTPLPPALIEVLSAKLRNDTRRFFHAELAAAAQASMLGRDLFNEGMSHVTDNVLLIGVRNRGQNVSSFCGSLASNQLRGVSTNRRDAMVFRPHSTIHTEIANMSLKVPKAWFRVPRRRNFRRQFQLLVCYEGEVKLLLLPVLVNATSVDSDNSEYFTYEHHNKLNSLMGVREVALILDGRWNNAFLIPKHSKASLEIRINEEHLRVTYNQTCDQRLGVHQPCCLWPFISNFDFGPEEEKQPRQLTFSRCIGQIPHETPTSPLFNGPAASRLLQGGMTRRLLSPPKQVCRESRFRAVKLAVPTSRGVFSKTLRSLDAVECAVYY